jgi:hypothetical protein
LPARQGWVRTGRVVRGRATTVFEETVALASTAARGAGTARDVLVVPVVLVVVVVVDAGADGVVVVVEAGTGRVVEEGSTTVVEVVVVGARAAAAALATRRRVEAGARVVDGVAPEADVVATVERVGLGAAPAEVAPAVAPMPRAATKVATTTARRYPRLVTFSARTVAGSAL